MAHLESRKHVSPDSGFPITIHPHFNAKIKDWAPPEPLREEITPPRDRAHFADPEKKALFSVAKKTDLTESIGSVLENVQLSQLTPQQLDELALLVNERGVVFFRDQDLDTEKQVKLFEHYGILDRHPAQKDVKHVVIRGSTQDHREIAKYTPWPSGDFHADTSFEINPPSYSLLRMEEHPEVGGDTAWISGYGLYDTLSDAMKRFVEGLHAVHTSRVRVILTRKKHDINIVAVAIRHYSRPLGNRAESSSHRYPSSSCANPSSDGTQGCQREPRLCNWVCRVEKGGVG
jgi:hypothetical protein